MPKYLLCLLLLSTPILFWGQSSEQEKLEQRKAQILKEIEENENLLQSVKSQEKSAVNLFQIQKNKIELKEKLLNTIENQTSLLTNNIEVNQKKVDNLNKSLSLLKKDYAKMILKSYKSRSEQSRAMFILSSENFVQAYKRAQYLKQYTRFRKSQGEEINANKHKLIRYNKKLNAQKKSKLKLLEENKKEKQDLEKEKQGQEKLVNSIKKDKNKIVADIRKKQKESKTIDRQLDRLIRRAIAEANRKVALEKKRAIAAEKKLKAEALKANKKTKTATSKTTISKVTTKATKEERKEETTTHEVASETVSSSKINLTPESKIVAENFKSNKGHLPWPVEKGFISINFGDQPHPIYNTLIIHNSGLEITTNDGAVARAVFDGEVSSVMVLSPVNKAVMIQHGDYFTIYQNLSSVSVNKGDKVSIKQNIGTVRTNGETGKTVIKFLLLQNTTYTDPKNWLSNK